MGWRNVSHLPKEYVKALLDVNAPLVLIDRYYPSLQTYNVLLDGCQASYQAARLLVDKGCKNIGLVVYDGTQSHMSERRYGFVDALRSVDLYRPELVCEVNFGSLEEDMSDVISYLLEKGVDGIFFVTISISLLGIRYLFGRGVKIQEDIQVVCFDRSEVFEYMPQPIPYVLQPIEAMGNKAVDLLLAQMELEERVPQSCKLPATLVCRKPVSPQATPPVQARR